MRVARIIQRLPPASGGKEIHGAELSRALRRRSVDDVLFWQEGALPPQAAGVRRGRLPSSRRDLQLLSFAGWGAVAVARAHQRHPFDLVHAHGDFVEAGAAALLARHLRIPALLSVHAALSETASHRAARRLTYSRMRRILTVTPEIADQIRDSGISVPVIVRPSGVRDPFFSVMRRRTSTRTLLTVGRLSPMKGIEVLIAARDKLVEHDLDWVVAAAGEGSYADELRNEIARRPNITLIHVDSPAALADLHAQAHAFVLPSVQLPRQAEGMPTALMEAMASRTPIVATATGGVARALGGGEYGTIIAPGDAQALANGVLEVLEAPASAEQRAERAANSGLAQPWDEVAEQLHRIYHDVLIAPSVSVVMPPT
jgi:glycosyltransferase involved in cell wall biosynthesis